MTPVAPTIEPELTARDRFGAAEVRHSVGDFFSGDGTDPVT